MLRFGLGLALALGALSGVASAQTSETAAASQSKPEKAQRSRGKERPVVTAQPLMVAPLPERKTAEASPIPPLPETWTTAEIDAAKARCTAALKGLDADVTAEAPIKEGLCGTPAPIRLSRLGGVTFSPAALINCGMLVPLNTWISKELQPSAQRQLGAKITKIEVMSDYSCRTAFGRVGRKLSQHAYVDALDIRGFVTCQERRGRGAERLGRHQPRHRRCCRRRQSKRRTARRRADGSGKRPARQPTRWQIRRRRKARPYPDRLGTRHAGLGRRQGDAQRRHRQGHGHLVGQRQEAGRRPPRRSQTIRCSPRPTRRARNRLTASLQKTAISPELQATPPTGPRARFLREAHASACRIFGTTLGPEANEAHRNHFHVDMAERKVKKICD